METRARYVLIGLFSVLAMLAGLGFFLWLAKVEINRRYAQYDILFDDVTGLGQASAVSYNGVTVGKVISIALDRSDPAKVSVRIEIAAETPIREDTIAKLASQGVTGVSFVALEGGSPDSPRLTRQNGAPLPVITVELTNVQGLIQDAPDLLSEAIDLLRELSRFTTEENRASVAGIIGNIESTTGRLDAVMTNLTETSADISVAADRIAQFADTLGPIAVKMDAALTSANEIITNRVPDVIDRIDSAVAEIADNLEQIEAAVVLAGIKTDGSK